MWGRSITFKPYKTGEYAPKSKNFLHLQAGPQVVNLNAALFFE